MLDDAVASKFLKSLLFSGCPMPKLIKHVSITEGETNGLGRGQHVFLAQRHRVQVRGFKRRAREIRGLFWEGRLRLLEDFGACEREKAIMGQRQRPRHLVTRPRN